MATNFCEEEYRQGRLVYAAAAAFLSAQTESDELKEAKALVIR